MNLIRKAILYCQREGLINTAKRTIKKCGEIAAHMPGNILERIFIQKIQKQLKQRVTGKKLYIFISCIDWRIPLFQRPHQMAQVLSQYENGHVLFVSTKDRYDNFAGYFSVNEHLDVVSWRIVNKLGDVLKTAETVTVFKSWPRQAELLDYIPYDKLIYEYIDDISLFYYYTEELKEKHYQLIQNADLTVCTARVLYDEAKAIAKKAILSPNAGDYDFFYNNRNCTIEPTLVSKIKKYNCVLGYYGCLASWFDYDLVINVAKSKPDWCFVLVGYCFDGTISRLREVDLPNIIIYPAQPYRNLPSFVAGFDIQTIPFVINDITKATSPVKLFEYMASGKPILTSQLPECTQYASVMTYNDEDDFVDKVQQLLDLRYDINYNNLMDKEARNNTWDSRVEEIFNELYGG